MSIRNRARKDRNKARAKYRPALERLEKREVFATLTGVVFHDLNGDGVRAADEPGLAGWTVFMDSDGNNVFDSASDVPTQTDQNGGYSFEVPDASPYFRLVGVLKPTSSGSREWAPTTGVYDRLNFDPTRPTNTVFNFGMRLNSLGNLTRAGSEVLVNPNVEGVQGFSSLISWGKGEIIDSDDAGNYVVGWSQVGSVPIEGAYTHRGFIRIYNADGTPRTGAIELGAVTSIEPTGVLEPFIAFSGDGTRIATSWEGVVRVYGSTGQSIGAPVIANPTAKNEAYWVRSLDIDHNGDFVVVSSGSKIQGNSQNHGVTVFQRYSPSGVKVGKRVQVIDAVVVNGVQDVAMDAAGNFLVTWTDQGLNGQRYSASGAKLGSAIKYTTKITTQASVSMLPNGEYALVWQERETVNDVLVRTAVARRFQPNGIPLGAAVLLDGQREISDVALDTDGTMRVTWANNSPSSFTSASWPFRAYNVFMRSISPSGALSDLIVVNSAWEGGQFNPQITSVKNGKLVVAWNGRGEGDDIGVFTQRFELAPPATQNTSTEHGSMANTSSVESTSETDLFYAQLLEEELDPKGRNKRSPSVRS